MLILAGRAPPPQTFLISIILVEVSSISIAPLNYWLLSLVTSENNHIKLLISLLHGSGFQL